MTALPILLASFVSIVFPRAGQQLPSVTQTYMIGSASPDVTNVTVSGVSATPYRTGAWALRVPVAEGVNNLSVVWRSLAGAGTNVLSVTVPVRNKVYTKLSYAKDAPRDVTKALTPAETLVYLDPGHGGSDTGAVSPRGWFEKNANLELARETARLLEARGFRVKMTRADDRAIDLYERARAAHEEGAAAFVSIHHNAPAADADPFIRYSCVYAWNDLGDPLARAIADRLAEEGGDRLPSKGALRANYAVTRSPEIPSCLVEADFITAPAGEEASFDPCECTRRAEAIAAGIADWCRRRFGSER